MALLDAEGYRALQLRIRARALAEVAAAWSVFRGDLETWGVFERLAIGVIRRGWRESVGLARLRLREVMREAGLPEPLPPLPPEPPEQKLVRSLGATGLAGVWRALSTGATVEQARQVGLARVSMAVGRHVLDGGRAAIVEAARVEAGIRWRRVASPDACDFCRMLAGRGAVYREETVSFQAHDGCSCAAEPVVSPPRRTRERRLARPDRSSVEAGSAEIPGGPPPIPDEIEGLDTEAWFGELEDWAKARHPEVSWELRGYALDPQSAGPAVRQLVDLMDRYPQVASRIERVFVSEPPPSLPNAVMWATSTSVKSEIGLNKTLFARGQKWLLDVELQMAAAKGWFSSPTIEGLMTHEFGHVVHAWLVSDVAGHSITPWVRSSGFGLVKDTFQRLLGSLKADEVSHYGATASHELWAETFAAAVLGTKSTPSVRRAQAFLELVFGGELRAPGAWRWMRDAPSGERDAIFDELVRISRRLGLGDGI